jgi:hypothetical protein
MPWTCFFVERTNLFAQSLRRFVWSDTGKTCPGVPGPYSYHNASSNYIGHITWDTQYNGKGDDSWPHDDPRWPKKCEKCDYEFQPEDVWQYNLDVIMRCAKTKRKWPMDDLPTGAMWYDDWDGCHRGPDGKSLFCKLPCGTAWCIDYHPKVPGGWKRDGVPPLVTASPSILTGGSTGYHGFLQNGILTDDLDGRKYPG